MTTRAGTFWARSKLAAVRAAGRRQRSASALGGPAGARRAQPQQATYLSGSSALQLPRGGWAAGGLGRARKHLATAGQRRRRGRGGLLPPPGPSAAPPAQN